MRRPFVALGLSLLLSACTAPPDYPQAVVTARYERSLRGTVDGFPFILLRGDHSERGEAHGYLGAITHQYTWARWPTWHGCDLSYCVG